MAKVVFGLIFCLSLFACSKTRGESEGNVPSFAGMWYLNRNGDDYEGKMTIGNCTATQCEFKLYASQYGHECGTDGAMVFTGENTAEHYFPYYDASIEFASTSEKSMNVYYGNTHSYNIFCGMNATVEGIWTKD